MKLEIKGLVRKPRKLILIAQEDKLDEKLLSALFEFVLKNRAAKAALLHLIEEGHAAHWDDESAKAVFEATSKKLVQTTRGISLGAKVSESRTRYILSVMQRGGLVRKCHPSGWVRA